MCKIGIIDYGVSNIRSVENALEFLNYSYLCSKDPDKLTDCDKFILPGVGAFAQGIHNLQKLGLIDLLNQKILEEKKPILGICLGMQLFAENSTEFGFNDGLGWIPSPVSKIDTATSKKLKLPHVGWNELHHDEECMLFRGIPQATTFYFVHSYAYEFEANPFVVGYCDYSTKCVSAIRKENIFGVQFHPEKSQQFGLQLIKNFGDLC